MINKFKNITLYHGLLLLLQQVWNTPSYQWQKSTNYLPLNPTSPTISWNSIVGANSSTYQIPSVTVADDGYYRCLVTSAGSTIAFSNVARLQVFAVAINITSNIPTSISIDEDFPGRELNVTLLVLYLD